MKIDLEALRRNAEKATPGPWYVDQDPRPGMEWNRSIGSDPRGDAWVCTMMHSKDGMRDEADAHHIASCDPQTVLALIEVVEAAQEAARLRRERDHIDKTAASAATRAYEHYENRAASDRNWERLRSALEPFAVSHEGEGRKEGEQP